MVALMTTVAPWGELLLIASVSSFPKYLSAKHRCFAMRLPSCLAKLAQNLLSQVRREVHHQQKCLADTVHRVKHVKPVPYLSLQCKICISLWNIQMYVDLNLRPKN